MTHICSYVPWQAVESDISHSFARFLTAITERRMSVSLIITPEVGVHYPNSGLPKDVAGRAENTAQHCDGGAVVMNLPPNRFAVPSFFAPEFTKRYYSFLNRMDSLLAEMGRAQSSLLSGVNVLFSGSFWKYYRSPLASSQEALGGSAGDFSNTAGVAYRQCLEQYYSQKEFMDPTPASANRWKTRAMDETNRLWFYQQSEDVFRHRSTQMVRRKACSVRVEEVEIFTPEADPGYAYSAFLQMIAGGHADFTRLSSLVDEMVTRSSWGAAGATAPLMHWTSVGGFRTLSDSEKQFLILKSLLLMGGRGGGILLDEQEWFSLSQTFRSRAESLARSLLHGEMKLKTRALYLTSHLWSAPGPLWGELSERVGYGMKMVSSLDAVVSEQEAQFLVVDPSFIMGRDVVSKLTSWAKSGRTVVLPRSWLYTEWARSQLELTAVQQVQKIEMDLGVPYRVHGVGQGNLVIYEIPQKGTLPREMKAAWGVFVNSLLSMAEIHNYCRLSDSRLSVVPLDRGEGNMALFILNPTHRKIAADLIFPAEVAVSDLAVSMSVAQGEALHAGPASGRDPGHDSHLPVPAQRFSMEVPLCGILPLAVGGLSYGDVRDRQAACATSESLREGLARVVDSELPGFDSGVGIEGLWN
ncbi:hypothetical protein WDW86_21995 [Bdellovibrionota bacterium FG-2]